MGVLPTLGALLMLLLASANPLRFDRRTLQVQARLEGLDLPRGGDFLVLTRDNTIESAQLAQFALSHWSFPYGQRRWLTLQEHSDGVWRGGFLGVDLAGGLHQPGTSREELSSQAAPGDARPATPAWLGASIRRAVVVYDSPATRTQFEARLPRLRSAPRVFVLGPAVASRLPLARSEWSLTFGGWLRLAALLGTLAAAVLVAMPLGGTGQGRRLLAGSVGFGAGLATLLAVGYIAGEAQPHLGKAMPFVLWSLGLVVCLRRAVTNRQNASGAPTPVPGRARAWALAAAAAVLYSSVLLVRLDFDGDTYTTYLPASRYYHLLGHHAPHDPGLAALVQGAVYPPAFPMLLALPLWLTAQPGESSYALGAQTSTAIAFYRLAIAGLYMACFVALAGWVTGTPRASPDLAGAAALGLLAFVPLLRGEHTSAETLLVPLLILALVAICAGRRFDRPGLSALGLFLGAFLTLVKLEGWPSLILLVLPAWLAAPSALGRARTPWPGLGLLAGLAPWVLWRLTGPATNRSFESLDVGNVVSRLRALAPEAVALLLRTELWIALLLMLPLATALRLRRGVSFRELLQPAGVIALCLLWICVYAFSTLGGVDHMRTSLPRVMLAPAVAALIYGLETLLPHSADEPSST